MAAGLIANYTIHIKVGGCHLFYPGVELGLIHDLGGAAVATLNYISFIHLLSLLSWVQRPARLFSLASF
jgi:hypothetical protein